MIGERAVFEFRHDAVESVGRFTRIEGRAVPYNTWANVGPYLEQFKPGAFAKSIRETRGGAAADVVPRPGRDVADRAGDASGRRAMTACTGRGS